MSVSCTHLSSARLVLAFTLCLSHTKSQSELVLYCLLCGEGCQEWLLNEEGKQHHDHSAGAEQQHLLQGVPVGRGET